MKKKVIIALVLVLVLVLAIVGAFFGSQYASHTKGNQYMESGEYEKAAEEYAKDNFFSKGLPEEAMKAAGLDYLEKENFKKAIDILEDFEGFEDEICRAYCGIAQSKIATSPEEALKILDEQKPSAAVQPYADAVRLEIAQYYMSQWMYDEALEVANAITDGTIAGVQELKNEVFFTKGLTALENLFTYTDRNQDKTVSHCTVALQHMRTCVDHELAAQYTELLNALLEDRFEDAAQIVFPLAAEYPDGGTKEQWFAVFTDLMPDDKFNGWEDQLANQERILALFGERADSLTGNLVQETVTAVVDSSKSACYDAFDSDMEILPNTAVDNVLKTLGNQPNGKVLILRDYWGTKDGASSTSSLKQRRLVVYGELMNRLPEELYPMNADEVEYVIVISYDYKVTGVYMSMGRVISGYQENGTVKAYSLPGRKVIYNSGSQTGPKLGNSVKMTDKRVLSGGRPKLGSHVMTALETIQQKMN